MCAHYDSEDHNLKNPEILYTEKIVHSERKIPLENCETLVESIPPSHSPSFLCSKSEM